MIIRFFKEEKLWYADLPAYIDAGGELGECLMISGAPEFLDYLSEKGDEVSVLVLTDTPEEYKPSEWIHLYRRKNVPMEGTYSSNDNFWTMWLCPVTLFVFGCYPDNLFIQRVAYGTPTSGLREGPLTRTEGNTDEGI